MALRIYVCMGKLHTWNIGYETYLFVCMHIYTYTCIHAREVQHMENWVRNYLFMCKIGINQIILCICEALCMCVHTYIHTYNGSVATLTVLRSPTHTYTLHTYIHTYTNLISTHRKCSINPITLCFCVALYMCMHIHMADLCTHTQRSTQRKLAKVFMCVCLCLCICACVCLCVYVYVHGASPHKEYHKSHTYIHACIHTCIHRYWEDASL